MKFFILSIFITLSMPLFAQKFWVDVYGGPMNYQGDLQSKSYDFKQAHFGGGVGITYDINDHFSARLRSLIGKISGDDKFGKNKDRNLNFASSLFEIQAGLQYYFYPLNSRSVTPYVFGGLGVFHFNPYTYDTTMTKYFLKPLSTEGEGFIAGRKPYALTQLSIPFGGGLKLSLTDNVNVGLELGLRKTFTDYLDDVSTTYVDPNQLLLERGAKAVELAYRGGELKNGGPYPAAGRERGNSKSKDWYYLTAITLSFRFGGSGIDGSKQSRQYSCPVF